MVLCCVCLGGRSTTFRDGARPTRWSNPAAIYIMTRFSPGLTIKRLGRIVTSLCLGRCGPNTSLCRVMSKHVLHTRLADRQSMRLYMSQVVRPSRTWRDPVPYLSCCWRFVAPWPPFGLCCGHRGRRSGHMFALQAIAQRQLVWLCRGHREWRLSARDMTFWRGSRRRKGDLCAYAIALQDEQALLARPPMEVVAGVVQHMHVRTPEIATSEIMR